MLAILAPGQGAQSPGMLTPWLAADPAVGALLDAWSAVAGLDLVAAGTTGGRAELADTRVTQPLVVATGLAALSLLPGATDKADFVAGHSLGEWTGAAVAGVLAVEDAVRLAGVRGAAMADAVAAAAPAGMSAVLGGDRAEVLARIAELGLAVANDNGPGQLVAAGPLDALAALAADPPARARVRSLDVAGAYHTADMAPAQTTLRDSVRTVPVSDPRAAFVANRDGGVLRTGADVLASLVAQTTVPVRWDRCLATLAASGVTAVLELPPAGTLAAIARRQLPGVEVVALQGPDDVPAALDLITRHTRPAFDPAAGWRLVAAPMRGQFVREDIAAGATVAADTLVGTVIGNREASEPVRAPGGVLYEWTAEDGDLIEAGQPVALVHLDGARS